MMISTQKRSLKSVIKSTIWHGLRVFHDASTWPVKILFGPARGAILDLDLRENGAYWLGTYDGWILDHLRIAFWLAEGDVAWDCGSYVGYYAALFRRIVGDSGKIIAFEASRTNYNRLRRLPVLNNWDNLTIVHLAVGPDHTEIEFAGEAGGASGPVGLSKKYDHSTTTERVACAGVDELCYERGLPLPDFIKFDLESAEEFALHNGRRVFTEKRPVVLLELHGEGVLSAVGQFLSIYNYVAWDVRQFDQPLATPITNEVILKTLYLTLCNTLVCIPEEQSEKRDQLVATRRRTVFDHIRVKALATNYDASNFVSETPQNV
jgi:FkbM family methyltransferase